MADIDKTFTSDFLIDTGSFAALSPELAKRLARLPEVEAASGVRANMAEIDGATADLVAVDLNQLRQDHRPRYHPGPPGRPRHRRHRGARHRGQPRAGRWARRSGVRFAETGERRLTVAAIFSDTKQVGSSYLLGLAAYDANFTDRLDGRVLVKLAEALRPGRCPGSAGAGDGRLPDGQAAGPGRIQGFQSAELDKELGLLYVLLALGRPDRPAGHREHSLPFRSSSEPGSSACCGRSAWLAARCAPWCAGSRSSSRCSAPAWVW